MYAHIILQVQAQQVLKHYSKRLRRAQRPWYVASSNTSLERSKLLENLVSKRISGSASGVLCVVSGSCLDVQRTAHEKAQNISGQNPSRSCIHATVTRASFSTLLRLLRLFKVILFGTTSSSLTLPAQLACFRNQSSTTLVVYLQQRYADPFAGLLAPA